MDIPNPYKNNNSPENFPPVARFYVDKVNIVFCEILQSIKQRSRSGIQCENYTCFVALFAFQQILGYDYKSRAVAVLRLYSRLKHLQAVQLRVAFGRNRGFAFIRRARHEFCRRRGGFIWNNFPVPICKKSVALRNCLRMGIHFLYIFNLAAFYSQQTVIDFYPLLAYDKEIVFF